LTGWPCKFPLFKSSVYNAAGFLRLFESGGFRESSTKEGAKSPVEAKTHKIYLSRVILTKRVLWLNSYKTLFVVTILLLGFGNCKVVGMK
jgi:hypothetical protein